MKSLKMMIPFMTLLFFTASAIFAQENDDRVLMTIGGDKVTAGEFMRVFDKNNIDNDRSPKAIKDYLELYINFRLKVKEAEAMGLDTAESFVKELQGYRKQLAQPYFVDEDIINKLMEEAYQRKLYDIRASHILIKLDKDPSPEDTLAAYKKIMDIRDMAMKGADFGDLAVKYSEDPSAKDSPATQNRPARKGNRGDLGFFTVFDMVYPFETAAYNTPVGSVSEPVRTEFGYHLIKVTDKEPALGTVQVAHIYVAVPPDASENDSLQKRAKIFEAYKLLQSGDKFEDVVKRYSEDKGSVDNGGKLPWFGSNRMVPEFIIAARNLKDTGDYSEPFRTVFGWHIIKLLGRKPVGTFEEEKAAIKSRLDKDQRMQQSEDAVIDRIKDEYGIKEYPKAREAVYETLDSTLLKGEWDAKKAEGLNKTVFSLGPEKFSQQDLASYIAEKQNKRIQDKKEFFDETYQQFVNDKCLAYENSKLEDKYPEFRNLVQEYHDGILLFDLTDQKVWSKAVKDTAGLREFYEQDPTKYMWGKRLSGSIVTIHHPENISVDSVRADFAAKLDPNDILDKYNNDSTQNISIETGKFPKGDNEVIDAIKWKTGLSAMTDSKEGPAFVYVNEILKPMPKSLDEARGLVTSDYQNYLEKQWIQQLRDKYPVVVNEEIVQTLK